MSSADEAYCADSVRRLDPDRYLLAMLAPENTRAALFSIYAFNTEIARIRESVSEALLGHIRLQWWRDALDKLYAGEGLEHAVVRPLGDAIKRHGLSRTYFDCLIEARSSDLDDTPPESVALLETYARDTSAPLVKLALETLDIRDPAALTAADHAGTAWALSGLLRAMPRALGSGWQYLPAALCEKHGFVLKNLAEPADRQELVSLVRELSGYIDREIDAARALRDDIPGSAVTALLPVSYSDYCQRQLRKAGYDPFDLRVVSSPPMIAWRLFFRAKLGRY